MRQIIGGNEAMKEEIGHITPEGVSIFDDLGRDPEKVYSLKIRSGLMNELIAFVRENNLNQTEAAERLGVAQGRISLLMNGRISKFTIDALAEMQYRAGIAEKSRYLVYSGDDLE